MFDISGRLQPHHGIKSKGTKITAAFGRHTREESRKAIVVRLTVGFERVLVTLSALQSDAHKYLSCGFCKVRWLFCAR